VTVVHLSHIKTLYFDLFGILTSYTFASNFTWNSWYA